MARLPQTEQSLLRHLRAEKRQRIRNENASPYSRSGMSVTADGVVTLDGEIDITGLAKIIGRMLIQGNLDVTGPLTVGSTTDITGTTHIGGTLNVDAATSIGGTLGVTGTTTLGAPTTVSGSLTVTGPMTVGGTLSLPNGIINNAALANPVSIGYASNTQSNFAIATTQGAFATATLTVPAGFTSAVIWSWAGTYVWNTGAGGTYVYLESGPAGTSSTGLPWAIAGGGAGVTATMDGVLLRSSLTGGATISISALLQAGIAIPANTSTQAWTRVMALWFR